MLYRNNIEPCEYTCKALWLFGIGVDRDFVLEKYGNPVLYIKSGKSNLANKVLEFLKKQNNADEILLEYRTLLAYFLEYE